MEEKVICHRYCIVIGKQPGHSLVQYRGISYGQILHPFPLHTGTVNNHTVQKHITKRHMSLSYASQIKFNIQYYYCTVIGREFPNIHFLSQLVFANNVLQLTVSLALDIQLKGKMCSVPATECI